MIRTSRLQEIVKVPQVQVIDEVANVTRSMRRQVLMIQEMQKDQNPEEVQISFKAYADRAKDGQKDTPEPQKSRPRCTLSPYLKDMTDKTEVQKDPNASSQVQCKLQSTSRERGCRQRQGSR